MTINNVPQTIHPGQSSTGSQAMPIESPLDEIYFLQSTLIPQLEHLLATARRRIAALAFIQEAKDDPHARGAK
ncbi:MAG: hypothetical protein KDF65_07785 [Anaerolineae bacterium]|nr:hypothetical protein [Anaerolineae bacterium]